MNAWTVIGSLFILYAGPVFAIVLLAAAIGTLAGLCARRRAARPVPYVPTEAGLGALADAVTCHWCMPGPKGPCTCGVACGHELCPRLSRADLAYTDHGAEMPR